MKHNLPNLPYSTDALAPLMSAATLACHHGKHLKTYIDNVNRLTDGQNRWANASLQEMVKQSEGVLYNNASQAWNHIFFFSLLTPTPTDMPSLLKLRLAECFGSVEQFKKEFTDAAVSLFGSGWTWLSLDTQGKLCITQEANAGNPMRSGLHPVLCVDVWEHAYYLDYQNRRADYLAAFWQLLDWTAVEKRLREATDSHPSDCRSVL